MTEEDEQVHFSRRTLLGEGGAELAVLRGRSYTALRPLRYADLEEQRDAARRLQPTQFPGQASPYTSFRVALAVP